MASETCALITAEAEKGDQAKIKDLDENKGVKVNKVDLQSFLDLYQPMQDDLVSDVPHGAEILTAIRALN